MPTITKYIFKTEVKTNNDIEEVLFMSHKPLVPEAEAKLDKIKNGFINEFGTEMNNEYKGNIPSKKNWL